MLACCVVAKRICLRFSHTLHSAGPRSGWQSHKGQLQHSKPVTHIHHTKLHRNAATHTLPCAPQQQLTLQSYRTAPTQHLITHHTYISLHMWQHPTSCKLNMPAKLPLHTDCSSGQETESSGLLRKFVDKWIRILVLLKLIYFKHKPL